MGQKWVVVYELPETGFTFTLHWRANWWVRLWFWLAGFRKVKDCAYEGP